MRVREIAQSERELFEDLAAKCGSIFHTARWVELFGRNTLRLGIYENGGELLGGFCLGAQQRFGFAMTLNLPFTPNCGPFLKVKAQHPVAVLESRRGAMEALVAYLRSRRDCLVFLRFSQAARDLLPFHWAGYRVIPSYTYLLDLRESEEKLLANMAAVRRRNILRAAKDGLQVRPNPNLRVVQALVEETFERQRKKIDGSALAAILFRFANAGNSFAFAVYQGDVPVACTFVVHDQTTAYYILGGYGEEQKHHGAGALAMWEAIKRAKQIGLRTFDFEGSVIPAVERYFRGFGGTLTPYFTANRAWLPLEILLKFGRRNLF